MSSIRDLARHLNISIGTVSRALNGRADVNAETRQRVLAAAAKLNYVPNQSGRNLAAAPRMRLRSCCSRIPATSNSANPSSFRS